MREEKKYERDIKYEEKMQGVRTQLSPSNMVRRATADKENGNVNRV